MSMSINNRGLPPQLASQVMSNVKEELNAMMGKLREGMQSGKITPQELGPLLQGMRQLAQSAKGAMADGKMTMTEMNNLSQQSLNTALNIKSSFTNGSTTANPGMANTALPPQLGAQVLNNLKQEQSAMLGKIAEGVKSGKITPQELSQLMKGVEQLAQATKSASADGQITRGEAAQLSQMSMNNALNGKSAFENSSQSSFAPFSPVAQTAARQLGAISQGVQQGSIGNGELAMLAESQGALAAAASRSPTDTARLTGAQKMMDVEIGLARLSNVNV
ncbi:hypothetical protein [Cystobacter fuscus]|uniref:hypothetical protein n=1 Tax=Cystobacter fuscus TaxID=43 RepID=UPI002B31DA6A|nr:hypothetical protein F0U63_40575 [Cystobacter fuscus]